MNKHTIAIAADHGGFDLKEEIKTFTFSDLNIEWIAGVIA